MFVYFLRGTGYIRPDQPLGISTIYLGTGVLAHGWAKFLRWSGVPVPLDGGSAPYRVLAILAVWAGVLAGLIGLLRFLRQEFGPRPADWTAVATLLATPLLFFALLLSLYAHAMAFAVQSALLMCWWLLRFRGETPTLWRDIPASRVLALGMLVGVTQLFRTEGILLSGTIIAFDLSGEVLRRRRDLWMYGRCIALLGVGWFVIMLPQFALWHIIEGIDAFITSKANQHSRAGPSIQRLFFHEDFGLLLWHPWLVTGFLGLAWGSYRDRRLRPVLAGVVVLATFLSRTEDQGYTFGFRYACQMLPALALGTAFLLRRLPWARFAAVPLIALNVALFVTSIALSQQGWWIRLFTRTSWARGVEIAGINLSLGWWGAWSPGRAVWNVGFEGVILVLPLLVLGLTAWWSARVKAPPGWLLPTGAMSMVLLAGVIVVSDVGSRMLNEVDTSDWDRTRGPRLVTPFPEVLPRRIPSGDRFSGRADTMLLSTRRSLRAFLEPTRWMGRLTGFAAVETDLPAGTTIATVYLYGPDGEKEAALPLILGENICHLHDATPDTPGILETTETAASHLRPITRVGRPTFTQRWDWTLDQPIQVRSVGLTLTKDAPVTVHWRGIYFQAGPRMLDLKPRYLSQPKFQIAQRP